MESRDKLIYVISGLFIISFIAQLVLTQFEFRMSLMGVFLQLILSWVLSQLFYLFFNKQNYSKAGLWMSWYGFIIVGAILLHFVSALTF